MRLNKTENVQKTRKTVIFAAFVFYARRLTSFILTVISYRGRQKKWDFLKKIVVFLQ